jgi:glycosyltransferase involved in cell wall biosynthesis
MDIGAVIVCYQTPEIIKKAVESVKPYVKTVTVVDNSPKGSECYKVCDTLGVNVYHTEKNIFHGPALNLGINITDTEYILIMDSDAYLTDSSILPKYIEELKDPSVYAVGHKVERVPEKSMYKREFDYLRPYFAMFKKNSYYLYEPFKHHGAPWCYAMIDIWNKKRVVEIRGDYVIHDKQQTRKVAGRSWQVNWEPLQRQRKYIKRMPEIKPVVKKVVELKEYEKNMRWKAVNSQSEYKLLKGVVIQLGNRRISEKTLTDAIAKDLLKKHPKYKRFFSEIPDEVKPVTVPIKPKVQKLSRDVLMICFVYNERKYLPHVINFWKNQGVRAYVIDNYSNDGTWEWLKKNKIPSHRFDTQEMFHLGLLQKELVDTLHKLQPEWVIYGAADLYYGYEKPLGEILADAEKGGYNQIKTQCVFAVNTGEHYKLPLVDNYYWVKPFNAITMITKYDKSIKFTGDHISMKRARVMVAKGLIINYGLCKPKEEQLVKYERRKKAWEAGMTRTFGSHYDSASSIDWCYDRKNLIDMRKHDYYKFLLKIKGLCG